MTNTDLLHAMGRIDPGLIAAAAPDAAQKKPQHKTWVKWASLAACLCLVIGTLIGVPMLRPQDNISELPTDIDRIIWAGDMEFSPSIGVEIPLWEGWRVNSRFLYQELEDAEPEQYFALHISMTAWEQFVYEGKSVAEISREKNEKYALIEKLDQLLKEGHALKYGDRLCTEGTPTGEKWSKALYKERIEYYGTDFLAKYIADGEFDQATAERDYANSIAEVERLEKLYGDSYQAYHSSYVDDVEKILSDKGVCTVEKNHKLFIFIQKQALSKLDIPNKENYRLSSAKRRNYEHEEGNIPTFETNITGFALEKIQCETYDHSSRFANSDEELVEKINAMIKVGQFDTDSVVISITSSEALTEALFSDIKYESITVTRKYKAGALAWVYVKYENINLEALKKLSNMSVIDSINIYLKDDAPFIPA